MPAQKLKAFLDEQRIKYVTIRHSLAYTAQETAASAHVSGKQFAKTVMVDVDGTMSMAVLCGDDKLDLDLLRSACGAGDARIAAEDEFRGRFPGVDVGAMPPFGNLWDMPVYVDEALAENDEIAFNAGSHSELVRMRWSDYRRLVEPVVARLSMDLPVSA